MPRDTPFEPIAEAPVDLAKVTKLHELLALALDDFEKVLGDRAYSVDMNSWHTPRSPFSYSGRAPSICHVCLAGAVMAKRLGAGPHHSLNPAAYGEETTFRLGALDDLRHGDILDAWRGLHNAWADGGDFPDAVADLTDKWADRIPHQLMNATSRAEGRGLLAYLRKMQADLQEADL